MSTTVVSSNLDEIFEGKWNQLKGRVRETWGKLTDDDVEKVAGKRDSLVGQIQEKYGRSKIEAENEVNEFLKKYDD